MINSEMFNTPPQTIHNEGTMSTIKVNTTLDRRVSLAEPDVGQRAVTAGNQQRSSFLNKRMLSTVGSGVSESY